MPGTNAGTGAPLTHRCAKCKVGRDYERGTGRQGVNLEATGKTKPNNGHVGVRAMRNPRIFMEYRCLDCGHVGWTKHTDGERLLARHEESKS